MNLRYVFFALSIFGAILPFALILNGLDSIGGDLEIAKRDLDAFFLSVFGQFVLVGYLVSGLSLTIFVVHEASARSDYYLLWAIPVIVFFGIGSALPFYFYLRSPRN